MVQDRKERAFRGGVRVRIDAPGYSLHGVTGTVAQDMDDASKVLFVLRDGYGRDREGLCTLGSSEASRLRDQTPNAEHGNDFTPFWWLRKTVD